jgi:hypothetical protein
MTVIRTTSGEPPWRLPMTPGGRWPARLLLAVTLAAAVPQVDPAVLGGCGAQAAPHPAERRPLTAVPGADTAAHRSPQGVVDRVRERARGSPEDAMLCTHQRSRRKKQEGDPVNVASWQLAVGEPVDGPQWPVWGQVLFGVLIVALVISGIVYNRRK